MNPVLFLFHHFSTDLGLHLSSLLGVHGQDVLVVADGVLPVLVLGPDVPPQRLQDAVGLRGDKDWDLSHVMQTCKHLFDKSK